MKINETTSGSPINLKGDKLEEFEEVLQEQIKAEINEAEDYLEEEIRPRITENWQYYRKELPKRRPGEAGYVDNTCQATVDHYVAHCLDAFTSNDTLEVVPYGVTNPTTTRVINQVVNAVLDSENQRFNLYQAFFRDCFVSCASIFKPFITEETKIEKQFFSDARAEELAITLMQLESSMKYTRVEQVITEEKTIQVTTEHPVEQDPSFLGSMAPVMDVQNIEVTLQSGYFALVSTEKTVKIEPVPAENFLINKDARSITDARFVGHKAMVTISDLLAQGFDYDKVSEVYESAGSSDDADSNEASMSRRRAMTGDTMDSTSVDNSQKEVELYEIYIKSSVAETLNEDDEIAVAKLYQVFYAEGILLDYQEVDFIPYSGTSPKPVPHMFWGTGMVDDTKHIQTAKTGLLRQQFSYNELATRPRFWFIPEQINNANALHNTQPGVGIAVKSAGALGALQLAPLAGDNAGLSTMLDGQREVGTGMSFTGQGMLGEVLKAGGSTISAQMVLTEGQIVQKAVIQNLLENGIKPLIKSVYNLLRENFNEWEVTVDGETFTINPNEWPRLREIRINTPLGKSAKLEKAQSYMSLYTLLASAQGEAAKLVTPEQLRALLIASYEAQEVVDVSSYLAPNEVIQQKDVLTQQVQQLTQSMQEMQQQLTTAMQQNQVLTLTASDMAKAELELKQRDMALREDVQRSEIAQKADEQQRKEDETIAKMQNMADKVSLSEEELELKYNS